MQTLGQLPLVLGGAEIGTCKIALLAGFRNLLNNILTIIKY